MIAITGANGLIGKSLCKFLIKKKYNLRLILRKKNNSYPNAFVINSINHKTKWNKILKNVECIVHCAGYSKSHNNENKNISNILHLDYLGAKRLAEQAVKLGVKRLIYISSIKVNGEFTINKSFNANSKPNPKNLYASTKFKIENKLLDIAHTSNLEIIIIRPPLVYGVGVKGNFNTLFKLIKTGLPLPFLYTRNKRSFIAMDNLVSFIQHCINNDNKANLNRVFLVSDGDDISTKELFKRIAKVLNKNLFLFPLPKFLILFLSIIFKKKFIYDRLFNSLEIDIEETKKLMNWEPITSMSNQLNKMIVYDKNF